MGTIADISEILLELGLETPTDLQRAVAAQALTRAAAAVRRHLKYDPAQASRTEYYPQGQIRPQGETSIWEASDNEAYLRARAGSAGDELQVQHIPVRSSPAVDLRIDYDGRSGTKTGAFAAETAKVEGTDYWPNYDGQDADGNKLCRDGLIRSHGLWPAETGSIKIVYTAGYSAGELRGQVAAVDATPILSAVIDEAARRAKKAFVSGYTSRVGFVPGLVTSESLGDYSYSIDAALANKLFGSSYDLMGESKEALADFVNFGYQLAS